MTTPPPDKVAATKIEGLENAARKEPTIAHLSAVFDEVYAQEQKDPARAKATIDLVRSDDLANHQKPLIVTDDQGKLVGVSGELNVHNLIDEIYGIPSGLTPEAREKAMAAALRQNNGLKPDASDADLKQAQYDHYLDFVRKQGDLPADASNKQIIDFVARASDHLMKEQLELPDTATDREVEQAFERKLGAPPSSSNVDYGALMAFGIEGDQPMMAKLLGLSEDASFEQMWRKQRALWNEDGRP